VSVAIGFDNVDVSYPLGWRFRGKRHRALKGISLEIRHGERLAVLGSNGSGKSTLLRLIADLIVPDAGHVSRNHGPCQMLNLSLGFMPHLSGRQNVILSGLLQGFSRNHIDSRLGAVEDFSELGDFFDLPLRTYSSGMRARLGFSLAMELSPDMLVIDEALGVGDAAFQEKSRSALTDKIHSGLTVILVSHNEPFARETCDRAVWLSGGEVKGIGSVDEMYRKYRDWDKSTRAVARSASDLPPENGKT